MNRAEVVSRTFDREQLSAAQLHAARRLALDGALAQVVRALGARDVSPLLLKGPNFALALYEHPAERSYRDIDLLVSPDRFDAARVALADLGFEQSSSGAHAHERADYHELWFRGGAFPTLVELHHTLDLVPAAHSLVWQRLNEDARTIEIAGTQIRVPCLAACALIVALHATQHGVGAPRPMRDLERAVERIDTGTWRLAAALARDLGAEPAFALGLSLAPAGRDLADRLGLSGQISSRALRLKASTPPGTAMGIEQLIAARGVRARAMLLRRKVAPSRESMRFHHALARRGSLGLASAYLVRPLALGVKLPRGAAAWLAAARSSRTPATPRWRWLVVSTRLLRRVHACTPSERRLLLRASLILAAMRLAVVVLPFRLIARAIGLREGVPAGAGPDGAEPRAAQIGWAVRSAAAHTPWRSTCLIQALTGAVLLRSSGIDGTLQLGVAKATSPENGIDAHAWLSCGPLVLTGEDERARYTAIATFAVVGRAGRSSPERF